jgi:hypothetical protein
MIGDVSYPLSAVSCISKHLDEKETLMCDYYLFESFVVTASFNGRWTTINGHY